MKDLVQEYKENPTSRVPYLPLKTVKMFQQWATDNTGTELWSDVERFMDTTHYSTKTKRDYRNRLRRFLHNVGEL